MSKECKFLLPLAAALAQLAGAATLTVSAGGDLQSTLNAARSGDTIQIAAGAVFTGHFYLPANPGNQTITIQSSAMNALPAGGNRVGPAQANSMPKLVTPDGSAALQMTTGAAYYRIQGIEIHSAPGQYVQDLIQVGTGGENSGASLPHDIDFDRDYIHGDPAAGGKRGIALNGSKVTIENCYISTFFSTWQDTQAIEGWNGPGPFTIINNHLEAGSENVAFGGAVPAIQGLIPSDILIQRNEFYKPLSWQVGSSTYAGIAVWAKNHIELKNAQRVTIDNNTFTNNWVGADQRGFVMVFNVRCEQGAVPWAVVNNVTVSNNVIRHAAAGAVFAGQDSSSNNEGTAGSFLIQNNVWEDISSSWGNDGRLFQVQQAVKGITIDHNTAFQTGYVLVFSPGPSYNVNFTNNIVNMGWGVDGVGQGVGNPTLQTYDLGGVFERNGLIGGNGSGYPAGNFYPGSIDAVGFVNYPGEDFLLNSSSPYINGSTDGSALGATVPTSSATPSPVAPSPVAPSPVAPNPVAPNPVAPNPVAPSPVAPSPTPTTGTSIPTGWVQIVNNNSGSCIDVTAVGGSQLQSGTRIQQYACWGGTNQQFQFIPVSGGYEITNRASGLQLDVSYASTADGAAIIQYPFWGGANEVWSLASTGNGFYTIHPNSSGKCMDVYAASTANSVQIEQWSCNGGANQQFKLVPVQ